MVRHSHPAKWDGNKYLRKRTGTYRDNNKGYVYNKAGKRIGYEPVKAHPYGDDHMSQQKADKAMKLFERSIK